MRFRCVLAARALLCTLAVAGAALAHKPSDSYLSLDTAAMQGAWDIALIDLDDAVGLDANGDGAVTWGELKARQQVLFSYALSRLAVQGDGAPCRLEPVALAVDDHTDGAYAVLRFRLGCAQPSSTLSVRYSLLFDLDPTHRGIVRVTSARGAATAVLGPAAPQVTLEVAPPGPWSFVARGMAAVFLQAFAPLVLLALLLRPPPPQGRLVTAATFTVALSLGFAASGVAGLALAPRVLRALVLGSLGLAAASLLPPRRRARSFAPVFALGLVQGLDFAQRFGSASRLGAPLAQALPAFGLGLALGLLGAGALFCAARPLAKTASAARHFC